MVHLQSLLFAAEVVNMEWVRQFPPLWTHLMPRSQKLTDSAATSLRVLAGSKSRLQCSPVSTTHL